MSMLNHWSGSQRITFIIFLSVQVFLLAYISIPHIHTVPVEAKGVLGTPETELQMAASQHVDAGN